MIKSKDFSDFLASRRSTRSFKSTQVDTKIIDELIEDGLTAPSWSNTRPFMVAVATGEVRDRISKDMLERWAVGSGMTSGNFKDKIKFLFTPRAWPLSDYPIMKAYPKSLQPRAKRVGKELYGMLGVARGDRKARDAQWAKNYEFFNAPVEIFVFIHKGLSVFAANDAGLFAENLVLSAHAKGLGTCSQGAVAIWPKAVHEEFNIPKGYKLIYGIAIGYPDDAEVNTFKAHRIGSEEIKLRPGKATPGSDDGFILTIS
jgi:nitroreductase